MEMIYPQPRVGTLPPLSTRDDFAHIDFVIGLRDFIRTELEPVVHARTDAAVAAFTQTHGHAPMTLDEVRDCVEALPVTAVWQRLTRAVQQNTWIRLQESFDKRFDSLTAELDVSDSAGPGSVSYQPDFMYPEYFDVEYHLQPGGFHKHPLMGHIYQYGSYTIIPNAGDGDAAQRKLAAELPVPADGIVTRVLDMGCSAGQATTGLKQRFPAAEVWGIDAGAPMVRYAHKRAVELDLDVHFAQRLAEKTGFPDGHFDIVFAFILLHEVPVAVAKQIVAEAHRILRPGGILVVEDVPNFQAKATVLRHFRNFNIGAHNAEPYWYEWTLWDFDAHLQTVFRAVSSRRAGVYDLEGNDDMHIAEK